MRLHAHWRTASVIIAALIAVPQIAAAGSQTFTTSGTFTVPAYSSLTVYVYGAGGGGGGGGGAGETTNESYAGLPGAWGGTGSIGGSSAFAGIVVSGGTGGSGGGGGGAGWNLGQDGASAGSGAAGGAGGEGAAGFGGYETSGCSAGYAGGGGGSGGYATHTFSSGELSVGSGVSISVGTGGTGGTGGSGGYGGAGEPCWSGGSGASGSNGTVVITWTDPAPATCSINVSPSTIAYGNSSYLYWSTTNADQWTYVTELGYVSSSGGVYVAPTTSTVYQCYARGSGGDSGWQPVTLAVSAPASCSLPWGGSIAHGQSTTAYQTSSVAYGSSCVSETRTCTNGSLSGSYAYASCTVESPPTPSCTVNVSPTSMNRGSSATLTWTSSNASSWFYISNVGYVSASGSATVAPVTTTSYSGSASGLGGTVACTGNQTLTVYQPCSLPWGGTIAHGESTTAYQNSSVIYGTSCVSETRICSNGSLSGTYAHSSCSVTPAANCTVNGTTLAHGSTQTFYSSQIASTGGTCASIEQSRTCTNGTVSGSDAYQYSSCSCAPQNYCSGNTVMYQNSACATSTVTTCSAPSSCVAGQSSCVYPDMSYGGFGEGEDETGELTVRPPIVPMGGVARVRWAVDNAVSCTVTGSNGDSWTMTETDANGETTSPITERTTFTLTCTGYPGTTPLTLTEEVSVNIIPVFQEF